MTGRGLRAALAVAAAVLAAAGTAVPARADAPRDWEVSALRLPEAHRTAQGDGVLVAVLDTGVVARHPALGGRVTTGRDFIGGGARLGQSYWGEHGTAMASDVLKVAPKARILSVRVIWDDDDPARRRALKMKQDAQAEKAAHALANGIRYAVGKGAKVISMSLGTDEWAILSGYEEDTVAAVDYAVSKGVTILASSGNGGSTDPLEKDANNSVSYPAAYPGVIGVAALGPDGRRADFSQVHTYTTIAAPGVGIHSARNLGGYASVSGTSPACAIAAGVVALALSRNPKLTPGQIRGILTRTARHPAGGYNPFVGFGQVDAAAVVAAAGSPGKPAVRAVPYKGKKYFGDGPTDAPMTHPPIDTGYLAIGGGAGAVGLLFLLVAFLFLRRPKAPVPPPEGPPPPS
ncbi:Serine protease, subtilisin family [Microbispora rosea]|uniref:Serine protease, subtilisin family n=1 Tax=Microbispora rosea TaxID=58117 RepID=A0A1N7GB87_9ACTN|nr:S8 family serine peptidase [Microbispora rosea]GIH50108.1 type VII secretion-associated serine protease [Microbispora rosea subsp. rosea]SIS09830.1 Serine protease, subtilisin family [Microbispora rosea]